jgi:putative inorganic carbon (HCO3(-)) transporter
MNEASHEAPGVRTDGQEASGSPWGGGELRSTLKFLAAPAVVATVTALGVPLPGFALRAVIALFGAALVIHTFRDPEWLLATAVVYLPLNKMFVAQVAPGLNGTNGLLALLLLAWAIHGKRATTSPAPGATLVAVYMVLTLMSFVTAAVTVGTWFVTDHLLDVKGWLDQFVVFFAFLRLIRDGKMARRMLVYLMLAAAVVLALGFQEWLEKRGASTIEKSRLLGPQMQPNDFGAYLACTATFFVAPALINLRRWRIWAMTIPYLVVLARVMLTTFSRGAYLGAGLAAVVVAHVRGKVFILGAAVLGLVLAAAMPELVPQSLRARMSQTESGETEELDASSQTRLVLWKAALTMTAESPVFGWGFKAFPRFKGRYTEVDVPESDNHNMYLYLSSQMGIPAVVVLLLIFWRLYSHGVYAYRHGRDGPARVIGMSAAGMAAAVALVNMFGSRMVDICVTAPFWITFAVVLRLRMELDEQQSAEEAT